MSVEQLYKLKRLIIAHKNKSIKIKSYLRQMKNKQF